MADTNPTTPPRNPSTEPVCPGAPARPIAGAGAGAGAGQVAGPHAQPVKLIDRFAQAENEEALAAGVDAMDMSD